DPERRALTRRALEPDATPRRVDDLADDPQAEAEAAVVPIGHGALEATEDAAVRVGRDADAVVAQRKPRARVDLAELDVDGLATAVLDGVRKEVQDHLVEAGAVEETDDRLGSVDGHVRARLEDVLLLPGDDVEDDAAKVGLVAGQGQAAGGHHRHVE